MDLRTGRMYRTKEEALAAGVPESDIAHVVWPEEAVRAFDEMNGHIKKVEPKVTFSRRPFGSFKNAEVKK